MISLDKADILVYSDTRSEKRRPQSDRCVVRQLPLTLKFSANALQCRVRHEVMHVTGRTRGLILNTFTITALTCVCGGGASTHKITRKDSDNDVAVSWQPTSGVA